MKNLPSKTNVKLLSYIKKLTALAAGLTLLSLPSCIADPPSPDKPNIPDDSVTKHKPNRFAAFRIDIADTPKSRAGEVYEFDSDIDESKTPANFNKGLAFERALYLPPTSDASDSGKVGDGDNDGDGEDPEEIVPVEQPIYHFAILFNEDGSLKTGELIPLTWDIPEEEEKYPDEGDQYSTLYAKFYDSNVEEVPYPKEFKGTVWVVTNASHSLVEEVKSKLAGFSRDSDSKTAMQTLQGIYMDAIRDGSNYDDFLYLKDEKGNLIRDVYNHPYFTMSSSMVIKNGATVPAIDGGFKYYSTPEEAKDNPTKIYLERLAAKYTVLFKKNNKLFYLTGDMASAVDEEGEETGTPAPDNAFTPTDYLFMNPATNATIRYVSSYTRNQFIGDRKNVPVRTANNYEWKVNIMGWNINGIQPNEYLFKNINAYADYAQKGWFAEDSNTRTYWAEDPLYGKGVYPHQYRDAYKFTGDINTEAKPTYEKDESVESYVSKEDKWWTLKYFNFNALKGRNIRRYIPENTYSINELDGKNYDYQAYLRTGSHIIVTAQLMVLGMERSNLFDYGMQNPTTGMVTYSGDPVSSKYLMNDIYWTKDAYLNYVAEYLGYWLLAEKNQELIGPSDGYFYVKKKDGYEKATSEAFEIEPVNMKGGDAMVWVKPQMTIYRYYPKDEEVVEDEEFQEEPGVDPSQPEIPEVPSEGGEGNEEPEIPKGEVPGNYYEISPEQYEYLAFKHQNYFAQEFTNGMMYYVVGSQHAANFSNPASPMGEPQVGDYGTVRNNWYYVTVENITKPGVPVSNPLQEIIPNNLPQDNSLGVSLSIQDWHREFIKVDVNGQPRPRK